MRTFRRLCVYCGSQEGRSPAYRALAERLGQTLVQRGIGLVYGGGRIGLMGRLADAVLRGGGEVLGVIPRALQERELAHAGATQLEVVDSMHTRKARMVDASDGFLALPGGIGTLEELFETLTWLQLGFHDKPVGLLDVDQFFTPLVRFLDQLVETGFLRPGHRELLLVDDEPGRLLDRMAQFAGPPTRDRWVFPERGDPR